MFFFSPFERFYRKKVFSTMELDYKFLKKKTWVEVSTSPLPKLIQTTISHPLANSQTIYLHMLILCYTIFPANIQIPKSPILNKGKPLHLKYRVPEDRLFKSGYLRDFLCTKDIHGI